MEPEDIDRLFQYENPPRDCCDACGEQNTTLFYETPGGKQLCNDCGRRVMDSFERRGIGIEAIESKDYTPATVEDSSESHVRIEEILTKIAPVQQRPRRGELAIEYEYDGINWDEVEDSERVSEEELVAWGGRPGSYEEIDASGFEAVGAYFDSALSEANTVFLTEEGAYVYKFVSEQIDERTLTSEVFRVLCDRSRAGVIEELRPVDDVAPPKDRLYEHLEFHNDIESFDIETRDDSVCCRVILESDRDPDALLRELQTIDGVRYPKPDVIEVVDSL